MGPAEKCTFFQTLVDDHSPTQVFQMLRRDPQRPRTNHPDCRLRSLRLVQHVTRIICSKSGGPQVEVGGRHAAVVTREMGRLVGRVQPSPSDRFPMINRWPKRGERALLPRDQINRVWFLREGGLSWKAKRSVSSCSHQLRREDTLGTWPNIELVCTNNCIWCRRTNRVDIYCRI